MSIKEYLEGLDYGQLQTARELADWMIKRKDEEARITLWVVTDEAINYAAFPEDKYDDAVDRMCAEIKKRAKEHPKSSLEFFLTRNKFRESEVQEMLELGNEQ
jgi:hypothetical protein